MNRFFLGAALLSAGIMHAGDEPSERPISIIKCPIHPKDALQPGLLLGAIAQQEKERFRLSSELVAQQILDEIITTALSQQTQR